MCFLFEVFLEHKWRPRASKRGSQKSLKFRMKKYNCLIDFGVPLGSKMELKINQKSIIFQVGVPEGPRGRFWKDFCGFWWPGGEFSEDLVPLEQFWGGCWHQKLKK